LSALNIGLKESLISYTNILSLAKQLNIDKNIKQGIKKYWRNIQSFEILHKLIIVQWLFWISMWLLCAILQF